MPLVELRNVSKIYHLGGEEIRALDDVSLDIEAGEFISIIGPSGSGKSTLMHILGCLDSPSKGTINLDGVMIHGASPRELARIRRCHDRDNVAPVSALWLVRLRGAIRGRRTAIGAEDRVRLSRSRRVRSALPHTLFDRVDTAYRLNRTVHGLAHCFARALACAAAKVPE